VTQGQLAGDPSDRVEVVVRRVVSVVLAVVTSVALFVAVLAWWSERNLFESDEFADRATIALDSPAVRTLLADEIANSLVDSGVASLSAYRSALVPIIEDVEQTDGFRHVFRAAVANVHRAVLQRHADQAFLELGEMLDILTATAKKSNTSLASQLPADASSLLVDMSPVVDRIKPWRISERVGWLDDAAWVVAGLAAVGALAAERDRRRAVLRLGIGVAAAGVGVVAVTTVVPRVVAEGVRQVDVGPAVIGGVGRFLGDLTAIGLWLVPIGVVVAAAAMATGSPHLVGEGRRFGRETWTRISAAGRGVRAITGVVLVVAAYALVRYRDGVVPVLLTVAGALVGYVGVVTFLDAVLGARVEATEARDEEARRRHRRLERLRTAGVGVVVAVLVVGAVVAGGVAIARARDSARADAVLRCNGYAALCDRRLDEVAFAGSHNSMSAANDPGWFFAENLTGIPDQLNYGIRAFLLKSHYGIETGVDVGGTELIVTDTDAEVANNAAAEAEALSPEAVARAEELEKTVPNDPSKRGTYLCHVYCSLGATKFSAMLADVKDFLARNPDEVIMLFIGDYISADDTAKEFEAAGLLDRLWTYDTSAPPPTLREMIESRRNLLVLSEHAGGTPPWYTKGYGIFQDTPFTFAEPSDFTCVHNRGPDEAPLFEINHFITNKQPPSVDVAREVNAYDFLMGRVRQCEAERKLFPTIVAVNFYHEGDLLEVVNVLNGVAPAPG
jgi:hypothetical protein